MTKNLERKCLKITVIQMLTFTNPHRKMIREYWSTASSEPK